MTRRPNTLVPPLMPRIGSNPDPGIGPNPVPTGPQWESLGSGPRGSDRASLTVYLPVLLCYPFILGRDNKCLCIQCDCYLVHHIQFLTFLVTPSPAFFLFFFKTSGCKTLTWDEMSTEALSPYSCGLSLLDVHLRASSSMRYVSFQTSLSMVFSLVATETA